MKISRVFPWCRGLLLMVDLIRSTSAASSDMVDAVGGSDAN